MGRAADKGKDPVATDGRVLLPQAAHRDRQQHTTAALPLAEGQCYALAGGVFIAMMNAETHRLELWTYQGQSGYAIARTGFEIDDAGCLYERIFDFETEEQQVLADVRFTVHDLQPVAVAELEAYPTATPPVGLKGQAERLKGKQNEAIWT